MKCNQFDFKSSKERLDAVIKSTPLIYSESFSKEYANEIYLKPENLQVTGSFKIRGAYNKISKLSPEELSRGVICASAGNHAQGVAFSAAAMGIKSVIVMPKTTPLIKVQGTKGYGAEVVLFGDCYDEACQKAFELEKELGMVFIHPFDEHDVIEGQGTIALEILEELADADSILVPIGGGGLISGVAIAAKEINPKIRIIGVEPTGANAMNLSLSAREKVCLKTVDTIADGVAVKNPGDLTFKHILEYVDEIIEVSDFDIMEAFLLLLERHKIVSENAGALSVAALKKLNHKNKKIVCVLSGGNIDVVTVSTLISKGLVSRGRLFSFSIEMPDKPGELLKISKILADKSANVVGLEHNQFKNTSRFANVHLDVTCETYGHEHIAEIMTELGNQGYVLHRLY